MFKKEQDKERDIVRPAPEKSSTVIANGASFNGVLRINGSLRVDGEVEGQVQVTDVITIGPSGVVKAEIAANSAVVGGRIKGRIWAKERVVLQRGSRLEGDVHAAVFKIEDGAFFQGNCAMGEKAKTPPGEAGTGDGAQERNLKVIG